VGPGIARGKRETGGSIIHENEWFGQDKMKRNWR
jgi:hypothetical protein